MKKLLILLLVLGMASAANAALSLVGPTTINEGDITVIEIVADDSGDYAAYLGFGLVSEGGFDVISVTLPFDPYRILDPPYIYDDYIWYDLFFSSPTPGVCCEAVLECLKADVDVYVELYDGGTLALVDSLTIHQVPEPMTLALLGLGGLLLLRRRK